MSFPPITCRAFSAMQNLNISDLSKCTQREIRPFLPSLVRMSLLLPVGNTKSSLETRKQILALLVGIEVVNNIVSLLQIDYHNLEIDIKKEQQLRQKIGTLQQENTESHGLQNGIALCFERADVIRKVKVVLSELLNIQSQVIEQNLSGNLRNSCENVIKKSELFDNEIYLEEIADIICISLAELPCLLNIQDLIDTLLYVNNGTSIICWIIANSPDSFKDAVLNLISTTDEDTTDGKLKLSILYALSDMNPGQALTTRTQCIELLKMPSLILKLSLKDPQDLVAFISGLLLGNDQTVRTWFALYVRTSQKRKSDALQQVREELLKQLQSLVVLSYNSKLPEDCTVQAAAMLRLYAALRGIAGIKFNDDELQLLVQLITTKAEPTATGIRFISLSLCMLIACPSLISQSNLETKCIEWVQWLVKEETYFENKTGIVASFGEMLLLIAIHFHSNQITAISELVCSTLAMKIPIRANNTTRIKQIFTQEIFTEQVVTAHAVKVPVTVNLNACITGYLPIHCIHQLLKSRAFSKHRVVIKSWIYKQICNCITPLHPVMPALIEVYVNSLIVYVGGKNSVENMHKPLSENEILYIFGNSVPGNHLNSNKKDATFDKNGCSDENVIKKANITSQLLILYYIVLYEDIRLANMSSIIYNDRKVKAYSTELLSQLPIKYLLQHAQKNQNEYSSLFHPLLRLLITHFPHLSLVDDWIEVDTLSIISPYSDVCQYIKEIELVEAFKIMSMSPSKLIKIMRLMLKKSPTDIWRFAKVFVENIKRILDIDVPRLIQELYRKVWMRLNTVLPRKLWIMTINSLISTDSKTLKYSLVNKNILLDPLQVLRCDERTFRCPDVLRIVLRILQASLAASKCQLTRHILEKPLLDKLGQNHNDLEHEELKKALVATQESAAVQILLESCIDTENDLNEPGKLWALREVRGIICSHIHQVFISKPSLAKLVHFQIYPRQLLTMTVRGIPSMHICLDFLPELLIMPEMDKQIFAIDLTSYLGMQFTLPRSLSIAKLCLNSLFTLLGLLSSDARIEMFRAVLPSIVRFGEAFPVMLDDCVSFLMQLGRITHSQTTLSRAAVPLPILTLMPGSIVHIRSKRTLLAEKLLEEIQETFSSILFEAVFQPKIY